MAISLFDLSVNSYQRTLGAISNCLDRGLAHFQKSSIEPDEIVKTRLISDMQPFNFQVQAITHHSVGAIHALKGGTYSPVEDIPTLSYTQLQKAILDAQETLRLVQAEEINGLPDQEVIFRFRDIVIPFTAENFVLSFSLPSLHFHATTTYDILRMNGVQIGKVDYLGQMACKA